MRALGIRIAFVLLLMSSLRIDLWIRHLQIRLRLAQQRRVFDQLIFENSFLLRGALPISGFGSLGNAGQLEMRVRIAAP